MFLPFRAEGYTFDDFIAGFEEEFDYDHGGRDEAIIINDIQTSANTGGNTAESGETIEGEGQADVIIRTIINGEVVEDIDISTSTGSSIDIEVTSRNEIIDGEIKTENKVEVGQKDKDESEPLNKIPELSDLDPVLIFSEEKEGDATGSLEDYDKADDIGCSIADLCAIELGPDPVAGEDEVFPVVEEDKNIIVKIFLSIINGFKQGILKLFGIA